MDTDQIHPPHFPVTDIRCQDITIRRRDARANPSVNGIDYIEVTKDKKIILVLLISTTIDKEHIQIQELLKPDNKLIVDDRHPQVYKNYGLADDEPGKHSRIFKIDVSPQPGQELVGDYKLKLRISETDKPASPLPGFDPLLSEAQFSFEVNSEIDQDLSTPVCPPSVFEEPEINYLAKDYASFRQLALDRLALIMPEWKEHRSPDLGITLVEILAYAGDYLSYYQDAVATEAYLDTARQRISVRRHARLVDYRMHEGCNARALLAINVESNEEQIDLKNVYFITDYGMTFPLQNSISRESELEQAIKEKSDKKRFEYEIFEPVEKSKIQLYAAHKIIYFYTWGERECCLPKGAIQAALHDGDPLPIPSSEEEQKISMKVPDQTEPTADEKPDDVKPSDEQKTLQKQLDENRILRLFEGDFLIFEELIDPRTGLAEDADPAKRHAVRLTKVTEAYDLVNRQAVLEIEWDPEDALPFPLCLATQLENCEYKEDISVAYGNIVLVDHGETVEEDLDPVEPMDPQVTCDECGEEMNPISRPYHPHLEKKHLVFRERISMGTSVKELIHHRQPEKADPQVVLSGEESYTGQTLKWNPRYDLLSSGGDDRHFVVEMDDERVAHLRFGYDLLSERPRPGTKFKANYRIGNPLAGNVGAEAINRMIYRGGGSGSVTVVRNPMPATGGSAPEKVSDVKLRAPHAFRHRLQRAITEEDYARLAEREVPGIQKAFVKIEKNGKKRYDVKVRFDLLENACITPEQVEQLIEHRLSPYRCIGHNIKVEKGNLIDLILTVLVDIKESSTEEWVVKELNDVLGNKGFFHPNQLTFQETISLSQIATIAQRVTGVEYVREVQIDKADGSLTLATWPAHDEILDSCSFKGWEIPNLQKLEINPPEVDTLGFSKNVVTSLQRGNVSTVPQLFRRVNCGDKYITSIKGIAAKGLSEIKDELKKAGYQRKDIKPRRQR